MTMTVEVCLLAAGRTIAAILYDEQNKIWLYIVDVVARLRTRACDAR
jgi:hypothetical protein